MRRLAARRKFLVLLPLLVLGCLASGSAVGASASATLSVAEVSVTETNAAKKVALTVRLSRKLAAPTTVRFATVPGTATSADYVAVQGRLTIKPGKRSGTIFVTIKGDTLDEPTETLSLRLSKPKGAKLKRATAKITIQDDDEPQGGAATTPPPGVTPPSPTSPPPTPPAPPVAPIGFVAIPLGPDSISLQWTDADTATSYDVLRSTTSGGPYLFVVNVAGTAYLDNSRPADTTYYYVVRGRSSSGTSPDSVQASATTDPVCSESAEFEVDLGATAGDSGSTMLQSSAAGICRGDVDWYKLRLNEASSDDIYLSARASLSPLLRSKPSIANSELDVCIWAYNRPPTSTVSTCLTSINAGSTGSRTVARDDGGPFSPSDESFYIYVRVKGVSSTTAVNYDLSVLNNISCPGGPYTGCDLALPA